MSASKKDLRTPYYSELGKTSLYESTYNPGKLFAIPRKTKRDELHIDSEAPLPFFGYDTWNHYEVSWLNDKGKPIVAIATISYDCNSPNIIESKSMKLYFNSLNNTVFKNMDIVKNTIQNDLAKQVGSEVCLMLTMLEDFKEESIVRGFKGKCIDNLDIACNIYTVDPTLLSSEDFITEETLYSDLLKSNCPVTNQPDWGSVQITYRGNKINEAGLLQYIVSFRNHNDFHEQCIERIFMDIRRLCKPQKLTVAGRYTRRGGLDINPIRSTEVNVEDLKGRLCRQ